MSNGVVVGQIEGYDVLYIKEKDMVFCKNTTMPYKVMKKLVTSPELRYPLKSDLVYVREGFIIRLGCLTTDQAECKEIIKKIDNINKQK